MVYIIRNSATLAMVAYAMEAVVVIGVGVVEAPSQLYRLKLK